MWFEPAWSTIRDYTSGPVDWLNANEGFLSLLLFVTTMTIGWVSGVFSYLRRRPKFRISSIPGPTFFCTYETGETHQGYKVHRNCFALYLRITNVGSAPSNIEDVSIAYHWDIVPFSISWLRYRVGWSWIHNQTVALKDFQVRIGGNIKFFPFLLQRSSVSWAETRSYLSVGQSTSGVVYFEERDSFGGAQPLKKGGRTKIKVCVRDAFGAAHYKTILVAAKTLDQAKEYNSMFGETTIELRRKDVAPTADDSTIA